MWILKSFSIIFLRDGDISKKKNLSLWYAMEHPSIINLSIINESKYGRVLKIESVVD